MIDRQPQAPDPQPRIPIVSDLLHCVSMTALVYLRSSFGYVFLRPKSIFFAFSWAFTLFAIVAWNEPRLWFQVRALCVFGMGAVVLYWFHLFRAMFSELRKTAAHDNYAGTTHAFRLAKSIGVTLPKNGELTIRLGAEPAVVFLAAVALRLVFSERYLSTWLFITAGALLGKEGLNYWFEVRREKRRKQMREEVEEESGPEPDQAAGISEPTKASRKPAKERSRARAKSVAQDEEERQHAEALQLPDSYDLEAVEQAYRDLIKQTHPDTHGNSTETTRRTAVLNEAVDYFRLRFKG